MKLAILTFILLLAFIANAQTAPYVVKETITSTCTVTEGEKEIVKKEITLEKGKNLDDLYRERFIFETKQYDFFLFPSGEVEVHRQIRDDKGEQTGSTRAYLISGKFEHSFETENGFRFLTIECIRK